MPDGFIAPLVAGWDRFKRGSASVGNPMGPSGSNIPGTRTVELFIAEAWVDVTRLSPKRAGVYYRDDINISRGRPDETSQTTPATCRFTLNNRDGRFSPRNPLSPYYGKIGRNTPCRVSVVQANGERRYRFYGEVSSWPQRWDISGTDVFVPVEAAGVLRRLGQGASLSGSAMYRGVTKHATSLVAYWPCEDVVGSTSIGSAVSGVKAMTISGTPTLASTTTFVASAALPVMGSARFTGTLPNYNVASAQHQVRFLLNVPAAGATNGQIVATIYGVGTIVRWELYYGTGGTLGLRGFDNTGTNLADTTSISFAVNGALLLVSLDFSMSGTTVSYTINTLTVGSFVGLTFGGTLAANSFNQITSISVASDKGLTATTIGHVTVQNIITSLFALANALNAYSLEAAGTRIARLCAEENINYRRLDPVATSTAMGYQPAGTLVSLNQEAAVTDMGILFEPRDQVGLTYRDRESLYDQTAKLALSYASANFSDALNPVDDDQRTRNDVTVTRVGGSSSRATLDTGSNLSVAVVGRYDDNVSLSLGDDTQLDDQAGWRLHMGTVDEARYPVLKLNLNHSTFTTSEALTTAALTLDMGDRITISNPPAWMAPDTISLIVESISERINGIEYEMTLNCSPASPYTIPIYDSATYRYSSDGSTLTNALTETATSVSVTTASGPVWSVADGSVDIIVAGERMTVTTVSGTTSPQTFTVTRGVNGIVKTQVAGAAVTLFTPCYYAI